MFHKTWTLRIAIPIIGTKVASFHRWIYFFLWARMVQVPSGTNGKDGFAQATSDEVRCAKEQCDRVQLEYVTLNEDGIAVVQLIGQLHRELV